MLTPVTLAGNYFVSAGRPFVPIGVNWVPARAAMQWPFEWDAEAIEADFAAVRALGFNCVRFDLVWQWFEPRPGQYNEEAFRQLDFLIELAHRYDLYLNPALLVGGEVGDAYWDVSWRNGRHPHADPDMLRLQARHVEELARRYRGESAIMAWDLTDEPPFWIVGDETTDAMAANWTQLLSESLRRYDPEHLVMCGTAGEEVGRGSFRADVIAPWVDLLSVHPYPIYNPDLYPEPLLSARPTYAAAFETMLSLGAGKPVLMQEFGATSAQFTPERQARYYNALMHSALGAGNQGFVAWCYTDADPEVQYHRAPYRRNPHETQFGITDHRGQVLPQGRELQRLGQVLQQMDLEGVQPAPIEAGIVAAHEWSHGPDYARFGFPAGGPYQYLPQDVIKNRTDEHASRLLMQCWLSTFILCRQAGLHAGFPREYADWSQVPLVLAPAPASGMSGYNLHTPFWQRMAPLVEAGTTLYASLDGRSAIPLPDARRLFATTLADRLPWQPHVQLTFLEDWFDIRAGETFDLAAGPGLEGMGVLLEVQGARVLARDAQGNPALVLHDLGRGHAVLSAYPLEPMLGAIPGAFDGHPTHWRLYRALRELAGIRPPFAVDRPEVEVGWLPGAGRGYVVLVNHTPGAVSGSLSSSLGPGRLAWLRPEGPKPLGEPGESWDFGLEGFTGAVLEWRGVAPEDVEQDR